MKAWRLKKDAAWPGIELRAGYLLDSDGWLDEYDVEPEQHPNWFEDVDVKNAGRLLDGRKWNEFPEVPHA